MKRLLSLLLLAGLLAAMFCTRPDKKAHEEKMMTVIEEFVDEESQRHGIGSNPFTRLGKQSLMTFAEIMVSSKLRYHDCILFTTTQATLGQEDKLLSVGIFGHVFTFDKEMLREQLH